MRILKMGLVFAFFIMLFSSCAACDADVYYIAGQFNDLSIKQHNGLLIISGVSNLDVTEQPLHPVLSHVTDISAKDMMLEIKNDARCLATFEGRYVKVSCSQKACSRPVDVSVMLDPGHGGKDPGAISYNGKYEKNIVMAFASCLKHDLEDAYGVNVQVTRKGDQYLSKYHRLEHVIKSKPDLFVSIHADAFTHKNAKGFGVFCLDDSIGSFQSQALIDGVASEYESNLIKSLANDYAKHLLKKLKGRYTLHSDTPVQMPLVVLRSPLTPSILLELGFISNPKEADQLANDAYVKALSGDIAESLAYKLYQKKGYIMIKHY